MGRGINRLSPARVRTLRKPGLYADGGNLWLRIKKGANGINKSWLFRYALDHQEHLMGLGPLRDRSLAEARDKAAEFRKLLLEGNDPLEARRRALAEKRVADIPVTTFKQAAREYIDVREKGWRSAKHTKDWVDTLTVYVHPLIGDLPVSAINVDLVLQVLRPIWERIPDTASRVRGRIEMVLDACAARGLREENNPARWSVLKHLLPKPSKVMGSTTRRCRSKRSARSWRSSASSTARRRGRWSSWSSPPRVPARCDSRPGTRSRATCGRSRRRG
jgi:integrase-like protein/Arm domain-containing DNA-binding protein